MSSTALNVLQAIDRRSRNSSQGVTEWVSNQLHFSIGGKILPGTADLAKLVVTRFGGLINEALHGQCAVKENA